MIPGRPPRVALFTDCYEEVNGVATTCLQLERYARSHSFPMLVVHAGRSAAAAGMLPLARSPLRISVDAGLSFDLLFWRHYRRVRRAMDEFQPDLIHITGPGDCSILGAVLGRKLGIPVVACWHTNLHQYASRRIKRWLPWLGDPAARRIENMCAKGLCLYYRIPRLILAPNAELVAMIQQRTGRNAALMPHGVDTELFSPARRNRAASPFTFGYVGRLEPEKNVRLLAEVETALLAAGETRFRFLIAGQGSEREWLRARLRHAEFTGVLRGDALAHVYANMDVFLFPSHTDTFGNVVLEALASGVPAIVTSSGGPKFSVKSGVNGFVSADDRAFVRLAREVYQERQQLVRMRGEARRSACQSSADRVYEGVYLAYDSVLVG